MSTYSVMNHIHHTSRYRLYVRLIRSVLCTAGIYYAPSYASLFLLLFSLTCYRTLLTSVQFSKSLFSECFFSGVLLTLRSVHAYVYTVTFKYLDPTNVPTLKEEQADTAMRIGITHATGPIVFAATLCKTSIFVKRSF